MFLSFERSLKTNQNNYVVFVFEFWLFRFCKSLKTKYITKTNQNNSFDLFLETENKYA